AEALVMIDAVLGQAYQDSLTAKREGTEPPALAPLAIRARKAEILAEMPAISFEQWTQVAENGIPRAMRVSGDGIQFLAPDNTYGGNRADFPQVYAYTYPRQTIGTRPLYLKLLTGQEEGYFLSPDPTNGSQGPDFAQVVDTFFVLAKGIGAAEPLLMQTGANGIPSLLTEQDSIKGPSATFGYVGVGGWEFEHRFMSDAPKPTAMDYTQKGHLLVGYQNGALRQWSPSGKLLAQQQAGNQVIHDIEVGPFGNFALVGGQGAHVWNLQKQILDPIPDAESLTYSVGWDPSGSRVVLAGARNFAQERSLKRNSSVIKAWSSPKKVGTQKGEVWEIAYSPNETSLLLAGSDQVLAVIDPLNETKLLSQTFSEMIYSAAYHPNLSQVLVGSDQVSLIDMNGEVRQTFELAGSEAARVAFSPDGKQVIALSSDDGVQFWGIADGKETQRFSYSEEGRNLYGALSISPDGKTLAFNDGKRIRFETIPPSPDINPGEEWQVPKMIAIKGGTFQMGSTDELAQADESPVHQVTVGDFELSETEVTVDQYVDMLNTLTEPSEAEYNESQIIRDNNGFVPVAGQENLPITNISLKSAWLFCTYLNSSVGSDYRLPTEAEWEYAAGGGATNRTRWSGTNQEANLGDYINAAGTSKRDQFSGMAPVKSLLPNALGLYDMSGNVWEWVQDGYADYPAEAQKNPFYPTNLNQTHIVRGGSHTTSTPVRALTVTDRLTYLGRQRQPDVGFRVARGKLSGIHIVNYGETLYQIAQTYGRTTSELEKWNRLEYFTIEVGQWLVVSPPTPESGDNTSGLPAFQRLHPDSQLELFTTQAQIDSVLRTGGLLKRPLVLIFWTANSPASDEQVDLMEQLVEDFKGQTTFGVVDVDASPEIRIQYRVTTIPSTLLLKGTKVVRMDDKEGGTLNLLSNFLNRELDKLQQQAEPPTKGSSGKGAPPSSQYSAATKVADGCSGGPEAQADGKCYDCPEEYKRTSQPITSDGACEEIVEPIYAVATRHGAGSGKAKRDCAPDQFYDSGEQACFSCPKGYKRTLFPVTGAKACEKQQLVSFGKAVVTGEATCPPGSFLDPTTGACWSCPSGYRRTIESVTGDRACEKVQ
ncbi:MAG: SUMF1/EgtB/PvdO family nonheme iron enzyme, partial [Bacteroidota bacterium]